ncbi:MAG: homoaconitate hydratase, partial [Candidatus Hecatellaceae archaeon]
MQKERWKPVEAVNPYTSDKLLTRTIRIDDTTLRDGHQTPGVTFTVEDKIEIAKMLDEIGVHQIEAGIPV